MPGGVEELKARAKAEIGSAKSQDELEELRLQYLGKKGAITALLKSVGTLPAQERPAFGAAVNAARQDIERLLAERRAEMEEAAVREKVERDKIDVTLPGVLRETGGLHPLTRALREILDVFYGMGFTVFESREAETDEMNFVKLNLAPGHPARDMQATFYLTDKTLLRTHTSPGQIRGMLSLNGKLPVRFVVPGRAYRRDPADASHAPVFHQIEGLAIDTDVTFRNLKSCLLEFARGFFGPDANVRLRPSYFPFTEPSAEIDVSCVFCQGRGCSVCGGSGWLEVGGAGMVHPRVIANGGYDPDKVTGFAFGMGIDRMAMLKYNIGDMRDLMLNDKRFLKQFRGL